MGKVEKLIVLSVLFVVAVILVVSLTMDDPLKKDRVSLAGGRDTKVASLDDRASSAAPDANAIRAQDAPGTVPTGDARTGSAMTANAPATAPVTTPVAPAASGSTPASSGKALASTPGAKSTDASTGARSTALLSANVTPDSTVPGGASEATAVPAGSILKTQDGLQDSYLPDMKFYTWRKDDSFRTVAFRYYGDYSKLTVLLRANEGRRDVQPGEKILVPVFDGEAPAMAETVAAAPHGTEAERAAPASKTSGASTGKASGTNAGTNSGARTAGSPRTHVVKDGESLWKIAKQELGAGSRWNEIYEANRDVLATPEAVHTGLRLRIP